MIKAVTYHRQSDVVCAYNFWELRNRDDNFRVFLYLDISDKSFRVPME